jgi:hypothetical protein
MQNTSLTYRPIINKAFREEELKKGLFIAVSHATRIPPHIGLIAGGKYHSLSIKGQDIDIPLDAFVRNTLIRKIPALFIKIKPHNTFSDSYLREHFITNVQQFRRVDVGVATCLSPIRLFFEEVYNVPMDGINYLYELLPLLESHGLLSDVSALNLDPAHYSLPVYTLQEINAGISQVREEYSKQ